MKRHWVLLWSLWAARLVRQPTVPVKVNGGLLRGEIVADGSHARYLAIPYAKPTRRFQAPDSVTNWKGIYEAIEEYVRCPQTMGRGRFVGHYDCLTLNIYTPLPASTYLLPVMVFIHGGSFTEGLATNFIYGPEYLVKYNVVLVTINYRLNIQGFLCLRTKEAPGNAGLKDQVAALKWVRKNIKSFGGDPDNVTIFGESAGSASVSYHIVSPMSKGLFHKAILQSGSSLSPWALQFDPIKMASLLTTMMGHTTEDPHEILRILVSKADEDLVLTRIPREEGDISISEMVYGPCVESKIEGVEPFLAELPYDVLSKGKYNKVPIMIGSNDNEGIFLVGLENDTTIPKITFEKALPRDLKAPTELKHKEIANNLEKLYMQGEKIDRHSLDNLSKFYGEAFFSYSIFEETEQYLKTNNNSVFSYLFNYRGRRNFGSLLLGREIAPNATHIDNIFYLFKQRIIPSLFENKMIDIMTTLWTNFAKYGEPIPETSEMLPKKWLPINEKLARSFVIDCEFSTAPLWSTQSVKYLREVYSKYRRRED